MNPILVGALSAAGGALLVAIGGSLYHVARKRIRPSPDAETLAKVVPAVNAVLQVQRPQLDLLIALGEAAQGKNNGNVTTALDGAREARGVFNEFLERAARIEVKNV
jgi:predicted membrane chloride channel (bestrophin family)